MGKRTKCTEEACDRLAYVAGGRCREHKGCSVDGCDEEHRRNGLCAFHSQRVRYHGAPGEANRRRMKYIDGQTCCVDDCDGAATLRGMCSTHYNAVPRGECPCGQPINAKSARGLCRLCYQRVRVAEFREKEEICSSDRCRELAKYGAGGLCSFHYKGVDGRQIAKQGDGTIDSHGYRRFNSKKYAEAHFGERLEHRAVMAVTLGRPLAKHENVHHINGVRHDNRPENLEIWITTQPSGQRPHEIVEWMVAEYPELVEAALNERRQLRLAV